MYAIEMISTEIFVVALGFLQVVANDYQAACHRDDGSLVNSSPVMDLDRIPPERNDRTKHSLRHR
jgi:hypothetical protein